MGKKKSAKKPKTKDPSAGKSGKKISPAVEPENDETFDYGGLPDRNLKKNLGCG